MATDRWRNSSRLRRPPGTAGRQIREPVHAARIGLRGSPHAGRVIHNATTVAFGIAAPLVSKTVPVKSPLFACAKSRAVEIRRQKRTATTTKTFSCIPFPNQFSQLQNSDPASPHAGHARIGITSIVQALPRPTLSRSRAPARRRPRRGSPASSRARASPPVQPRTSGRLSAFQWESAS